MKSPRAKVLHSALGAPLLEHVLRAVAALGAEPVRVVVGHQAQGLAVAGPSVVSVKWGGQGTTTADVPAIGVNETVDVVVPESATSCFQVDCTLTVTVDSADDLSEDDESNNVLSELCIVMTADHSHSEVAGGESAGIPLERILGAYACADPADAHGLAAVGRLGG